MTDLKSKVQNMQNISTPVNAQLSGKYIKSFAHTTIKDRLPVILTKIIDRFSRNKENIINIYGKDAIHEMKYLISFISKLKNEIVTNKTLKPLRLHDYACNDEAEEWNKYLEHRTRIEGEIPTWFNTIWLYCECYMYRVLAQEISLTVKLPRYDPFEDEKQENFNNSLVSINHIAVFMKEICNQKSSNVSSSQTKENFRKLLNMSLWGNKCDLSLSAGSDASQRGNPMLILESLTEFIISNDWEKVWNVLNNENSEEFEKLDKIIVDIILDNAGYELFTDLCLAYFLYIHKMASKIRFYVKKYPWYVSDVTNHDFYWMLEHMSYLDNYPDLKYLSKVFFDCIDCENWILEEEPYWTNPYDYRMMKEKDLKLYTKLANAKLIIFKGDLNYRKLVGDINYPYTINFSAALGNFYPTNIVSLRTVKSDVCVGLAPGKAESLFIVDENWMLTGKYGLIQSYIDVSIATNNVNSTTVYSEEKSS